MTDTTMLTTTSEAVGSISPRTIYEEVSKTVIGQDEAKKTIATAAFLHFVRFCQATIEGTEIKKSNALLMGPTGSGKTFIVRETAKAMRKLTGYDMFPVLELDCTEITARGWEGEDITSLLKNHYKEHGSNSHKFNSTIVFLDEFDKLCSPAVGRSGTDHNKQTQYNLLKTIEGTSLGKFDTHKMLFIMAGNFPEIRAKRAETRNPWGFTDANAPDEKEKYVDYHTELDEAGMATQLVGRTPFIGQLYDLEYDELNVILEDHLIPEVKSTFTFMGHDLDIPEDIKKDIINNTIDRKTGARGLSADLSKYMEEHMFDKEFKL